MTTLEKQKKFNKMINESVTLEEYINSRQTRDRNLRPPRFIHPSLQVIVYIYKCMCMCH